MDLTPLFNTSLSSHSETKFKPLRAHPFDIDILNSFLQEAYQIHGHIVDLTRYIRSIRAPYLALGPHRLGASSSRHHHGSNTNTSRGFSSSTNDTQTPMSDSQRTLIEQETRSALKTISTTLHNLSLVSSQDAALKSQIASKARSKRSLGALGRWAASVDIIAKTPEELEVEAKIETERLHREGVIYYLQKELEATSEVQRNMIAVRLQRTVEKNKSVLYKAGRVNAGMEMDGLAPVITRGKLSREGDDASGRAVFLEEEQGRRKTDDVLSPEQVQMFEQEQEDMVKYFNSELQKLRYLTPPSFIIYSIPLLTSGSRNVEASLVDISSLQTELAMNLEQQSESIDQLVNDSISTSTNVTSGNKELKKATERGSTAQYVFYATCAFCTSLIVWDLIF
jgi:syntaxin 18